MATKPAVYRPRNSQATDYYRRVEDHLESFIRGYEERFELSYGFFRPLSPEGHLPVPMRPDWRPGALSSEHPNGSASSMPLSGRPWTHNVANWCTFSFVPAMPRGAPHFDPSQGDNQAVPARYLAAVIEALAPLVLDDHSLLSYTRRAQEK